MSIANVLVVLLGGVLAAGVLVWFVVNDNDAEHGCSHETPDLRSVTDRLYAGADRPAGPDAEAMASDTIAHHHDPPVR